MHNECGGGGVDQLMIIDCGTSSPSKIAEASKRQCNIK